MKKTTIIACIVAFSLGQIGAGRAEEIFTRQMDEAAGKLVTAWFSNDRRGMSEAATRLTRYELYNAAFDDYRGSYLRQVPHDVMNQGEAALAAYIFLIRKERQGISLWPKAIIDLKPPQKTGRGAANYY